MNTPRTKTTPNDRPGPLLIYEIGGKLVAKRSRPNVGSDSPTDPGNVLRCFENDVVPPKSAPLARGFTTSSAPQRHGNCSSTRMSTDSRRFIMSSSGRGRSRPIWLISGRKPMPSLIASRHLPRGYGISCTDFTTPFPVAGLTRATARCSWCVTGTI